MVQISVVVPLMDEENTIDELLKQLHYNLSKLTPDYEIILIDDGSHDLTWNKITQFSLKSKSVKGIKFSRNFGHHYAITAGIKKSIGNWVVVMDGDLQDKPSEISKLYQKAQEGFDVVFASRTHRTDGFLYLFMQRLFYIILNFLSEIKFDPNQANFSIISRKVANAYCQFNEFSRFYVSTIRWLGFDITSVAVSHGKRFAGKPSYSFKKRLKLASDIIVSFSNKPLILVIKTGLGISIFAIFTLIFVIYQYFSGAFTVLGWPSLISTILLSTGIILIFLGVIGLYISKIFEEVKNRPMYIIDDYFD
jgi:dolichol-phosphate mannosyltransferase